MFNNYYDQEHIRVYDNGGASGTHEQASAQIAMSGSEKNGTDAGQTRDVDQRETRQTKPEHTVRNGTHNQPTNVSPATIEHYLKGMKYPADKERLLEQARSNHAPEDVIRVLGAFEEKEYNGVVDVNKEIGKVESH